MYYRFVKNRIFSIGLELCFTFFEGTLILLKICKTFLLLNETFAFSLFPPRFEVGIKKGVAHHIGKEGESGN